MQLVERGAVGLDDDVRPRVPELSQMQILRGFDAEDSPILEDNVKPITLRQVCVTLCPGVPSALRLTPSS